MLKHGYFHEFPEEDVAKMSELNAHGFEFDWTLRMTPTSHKVSYIYEGDFAAMVEYTPVYSDRFNEINLLEVSTRFRNRGLGAGMVAYVAKDSKERGFDGVMLLESKTALRKFYINKLGGIPIGSTNRIYFSEEAADKIIELYGGIL